MLMFNPNGEEISVDVDQVDIMLSAGYTLEKVEKKETSNAQKVQEGKENPKTTSK